MRGDDASQRHAAGRDAAPLLVIHDAGAGLRAVSAEAALVRLGFARGAAPAGAPVPGTGESTEVIAALNAHGTAHFACHGVANLTEPLDSALLLPGGRVVPGRPVPAS